MRASSRYLNRVSLVRWRIAYPTLCVCATAQVFHNALLADCSAKVKKVVLSAIGSDGADSLGYESGVELTEGDLVLVAVCVSFTEVCFTRASQTVIPTDMWGKEIVT